MIVPDSWGSDLREFNSCHNPSGPGGGRFCARQESKDFSGTKIAKKYPDLPGLKFGSRQGLSFFKSGRFYLQWNHGRMLLSADRDHLYVAIAEIDEGYRGKGLGKQMYLAARDYAKSLGYKGLMSDNRNADSQSLWGSLQQTGRRGGTHQVVGQRQGGVGALDWDVGALDTYEDTLYLQQERGLVPRGTLHPKSLPRDFYTPLENIRRVELRGPVTIPGFGTFDQEEPSIVYEGEVPQGDKPVLAYRGVTAHALARLERTGYLFPNKVYSSSFELPVQLANEPDQLVNAQHMYTKPGKKSYQYIVQVDLRGATVRVPSADPAGAEDFGYPGLISDTGQHITGKGPVPARAAGGRGTLAMGLGVSKQTLTEDRVLRIFKIEKDGRLKPVRLGQVPGTSEWLEKRAARAARKAAKLKADLNRVTL